MIGILGTITLIFTAMLFAGNHPLAVGRFIAQHSRPLLIVGLAGCTILIPVHLLLWALHWGWI